jgi:cellulose synthase/poly-beta-1,6-N-acetylglucosamine synthase-like glycosyltransferase
MYHSRFCNFQNQILREAGLYNEHTWTEDFDMALKVRSHYYKIAQINSRAEFICPETWKKLKIERVRWGYGTFQALFNDYPYMMSPKYGTVGTFFLPVTVLLGTFLIIVALLFMIYGAIAGLTWIVHNFVLGWKPILDFHLSFFDISVLFSDPRFILGVVAILISLFFLIFAQKYTKQKVNILYYFLFFIPYAWFLAYTQLEGLIRYIFKLKMSWGDMHSKDEKKN